LNILHFLRKKNTRRFLEWICLCICAVSEESITVSFFLFLLHLKTEMVSIPEAFCVLQSNSMYKIQNVRRAYHYLKSTKLRVVENYLPRKIFTPESFEIRCSLRTLPNRFLVFTGPQLLKCSGRFDSNMWAEWNRQ